MSEPTHILLTHGHGDHYGDTSRSRSARARTVVALTEIAGEVGEQGVENVLDPNFGGTVTFDWGWVKMVPAWPHVDDPNGTVTPPAGLLIHIRRHARLSPGRHRAVLRPPAGRARGDKVDVALVLIGGHYTMDRPTRSTRSGSSAPKTVIPVHYNTMPPIETDAEAFKSDVESSTSSNVVVLEPGETHSA